jgi:hypothetical protein
LSRHLRAGLPMRRPVANDSGSKQVEEQNSSKSQTGRNGSNG